MGEVFVVGLVQRGGGMFRGLFGLRASSAYDTLLFGVGNSWRVIVFWRVIGDDEVFELFCGGSLGDRTRVS